MKDLKFEQKGSLSRLEAADQLSALAEALRQGGNVELEFGSGTLSLQVPDEVSTEIEIEAGDGQVELEVELKWPTLQTEAAPSRTKRPARSRSKAARTS